MGAKIYLLLNWLYWQPYLFTLYAVDESVRDPINHLGSILYHSEPSGPRFQKQDISKSLTI